MSSIKFGFKFAKCLYEKQIKHKSKRDSKNKNIIRLLIMSKNLSKMFQAKEMSFDIISLFIKLFIV